MTVSTSLLGPNHYRWLLIWSLLKSLVGKVVLSLAVIHGLLQMVQALGMPWRLLVHLWWNRLIVSPFPLNVVPISVVPVSIWAKRESPSRWLLVVLSVAWLVLGCPGSLVAEVILVPFEGQLLLVDLPGFEFGCEELLKAPSLLLELLALVWPHMILELVLGDLHALELVLQSFLGKGNLLIPLGLNLGGLVVSVLELHLLNEPLLSKLLLIIVIFEVIVEPGGGSEALENGHHSLTCFRVNLLAVSALASWLILVEWVLNMDELGVGDVLDVNPFYSEGSRPLSWLFP